MKKFIKYIGVIGLLGLSQSFASFTSNESKISFLNSLQHCLQTDTTNIQFENMNYKITGQSFKSVRDTYTNHMDEYEAISWIEHNKDSNIYVYPSDNENETYWIRIVKGEKEFELTIDEY